MLDSLGSTLSVETINSFFTRNGKKPQEDELTMAQAIQCLETEVGRPNNEKKRINPDDHMLESSTPPTPSTRLLFSQVPPQLAKLDFSGPPIMPADLEVSPVEKIAPHPVYTSEASQQPLSDIAIGKPKIAPTLYPESRQSSGASSDTEDTSGSGSSSDDSFERVINVKNCPLCHRPRLNKKAEMDIVTHLAVCASSNWGQLDRIMVGNFVTPSQAQRKWYTRIISKVSNGDYRLGAVR